MAAKGISVGYQDECLTTVRCENLLIATWRRPPGLSQMSVIGADIGRLHYDFRDDVGFVNLLLPFEGVPNLMSKEVREEGNRFASRWQSLCTAHVVLTQGMAGWVVRSILRTMAAVAKNKSPWRVFDDYDTAGPWIAGHLNGRVNLKWTSSDVTTALTVAGLRANQLDSAPAKEERNVG
jgi:hypothetical protein